MAYKFSLGKYVHSGSMTAEHGLTVSAGDVALPAGVINNSELQHSGVTVTAGNGLTGGGQMDLGGAVTVNVAGAGALAADADSVYISSSIAGDGLLYSDAGGKLSLLSVAYGSDAKKAVQGNTAFTASAGNGLSGTASGSIGAGINFTFDVETAGAMAIKNDKVALSASVAAAGLGFVQDADGAVTELSVQTGGAMAIKADKVALSASVAAAGLGFVQDLDGAVTELSVNTAGAVAIKADKVAISASIAGSGLSAQVDADGAVTLLDVDLGELAALSIDSGSDSFVYIDSATGQTKKTTFTAVAQYLASGDGLGDDGNGVLSVQRAGAIAILSDKVALSSSVAGTGLTPVTGAQAGAVTTLSVKYGPGAGNAVQGNTAFTASAGNGLSGSFSGELGSPVSFTFDVVPAGAMAIKNDKVAISASIAGSGLSAQVDADGGVTSLAVDLNELSYVAIDSVNSDALVYIDGDGVTKKTVVSDLSTLIAGNGLGSAGGVLNVTPSGAIGVISDKVILSSSIAGTGLTAITGATAGAVTDLQVKYGPGAGNAVQGNTAFTASAGNGLTGDFSGELGSGVNFTFNVVSANGGIAANANDIELKLSSSNALKIDSAGLDLKDTIAGARTFSNDVTVNGNLYVAGTQTYVDSTNMMLQDPIMMLGSASLGAAVDGDRGIIMSISGATDPVFFWDQSELQFALAQTNTPHSGTEVAIESYADLKVKSLISTQGMQETIQTLSANGAVTASICLVDGASAGFTATLPDASLWTGKMVKVKKSEGSDNAVVVAASGSQTLDGVASISLESPYAAVAFVSNGSNWFIF